MKADTIAHYKILEFIKDNFELSFIRIHFPNDEDVRITDHYNKTLTFYLDKNEVKWKED